MKIDFFNCQIFIDSKDFPKVSRTPPIDVEERVYKIMKATADNSDDLITKEQFYYGKPPLTERQKQLIYQIINNIEIDSGNI